MNLPQTLLQLTGRSHAPARLETATLLVIDAQQEYRSGQLRLPQLEPALEQIAELLQAARACASPVIHVRHLGIPGGLFDPQGWRGDFLPEARPLPGEGLVEKCLPNAFAGTDLHAQLQALGRLDVLVCGFMSHSSVSSTVRAMKDFGYRCTLVAGACATRDLPSAAGRIEAAQVHRLEMAVLADNFATLVEDSQAILRSRGT